MPTPLTLLVAHPKDLIRAGLRSMLADSRVNMVGEASDAPGTLSLAKKHKPAVILLDVGIPGGDAFELAQTLAKPLPATKFVFVTEIDNPTYMARARAAGAANCLLMGFSQRAYQSCEQAVQDQIARLTSEDQHDASQPHAQPQEVIEVRTSPAIQGAGVNRLSAPQFTSQPSPRPATVSQVRAIRAICSRRKIDLLNLLREKFGLTTADELGIRQASNLIDELKSDEPTANSSTNGHTNGNGAGNGSYATTGGVR